MDLCNVAELVISFSQQNKLRSMLEWRSDCPHPAENANQDSVDSLPDSPTIFPIPPQTSGMMPQHRQVIIRAQWPSRTNCSAKPVDKPPSSMKHCSIDAQDQHDLSKIVCDRNALSIIRDEYASQEPYSQQHGHSEADTEQDLPDAQKFFSSDSGSNLVSDESLLVSNIRVTGKEIRMNMTNANERSKLTCSNLNACSDIMLHSVCDADMSQVRHSTQESQAGSQQSLPDIPISPILVADQTGDDIFLSPDIVDDITKSSQHPASIGMNLRKRKLTPGSISEKSCPASVTKRKVDKSVDHEMFRQVHTCARQSTSLKDRSNRKTSDRKIVQQSITGSSNESSNKESEWSDLAIPLTGNDMLLSPFMHVSSGKASGESTDMPSGTLSQDGCERQTQPSLSTRVNSLPSQKPVRSIQNEQRRSSAKSPPSSRTARSGSSKSSINSVVLSDDLLQHCHRIISQTANLG